VGIRLFKPGRQDTVLLKNSSLAPREQEGFDILIPDLFQLSPQGLYKKLVSKLAKHR
jgi:hypothetical protein